MEIGDGELLRAKVQTTEAKVRAKAESILKRKRLPEEERIRLTEVMQKQYDAFANTLKTGIEDESIQRQLKISPTQADKIKNQAEHPAQIQPTFLRDRADVSFKQDEEEVGVGVFDYSKEQIIGFDFYTNDKAPIDLENFQAGDLGLQSLTFIALPEDVDNNDTVCEYLLVSGKDVFARKMRDRIMVFCPNPDKSDEYMQQTYYPLGGYSLDSGSAGTLFASNMIENVGFIPRSSVR